MDFYFYYPFRVSPFKYLYANLQVSLHLFQGKEDPLLSIKVQLISPFPLLVHNWGTLYLYYNLGCLSLCFYFVHTLLIVSCLFYLFFYCNDNIEIFLLRFNGISICICLHMWTDCFKDICWLNPFSSLNVSLIVPCLIF